MTRILSAFEAVRPRGTATAPAAVTKPHNRGKAPSPLPGSLAQAPVDVMVMDRTGKRCVPLAPRLNGAFAIESGVMAQAAADKRQAQLRVSI